MSSNHQGYILPSSFVMEHRFENPLQRLILMRIISNGSMDGEGERVFNSDALAEFCCCSKQALHKEIKNLERNSFLKVRQILEQEQGYTITPISGNGL